MGSDRGGLASLASCGSSFVGATCLWRRSNGPRPSAEASALKRFRRRLPRSFFDVQVDQPQALAIKLFALLDELLITGHGREGVAAGALPENSYKLPLIAYGKRFHVNQPQALFAELVPLRREVTPACNAPQHMAVAAGAEDADVLLLVVADGEGFQINESQIVLTKFIPFFCKDVPAGDAIEDVAVVA